MICPYCGYENPQEAMQEHGRELEHLHQATEDVKGLKDRTAKKAVRKSTRVIGCVVGAFLVLAVIVYLVTAHQANTALSRQNDQISTLESYYTSGDYEQMTKYLEQCENSSRQVYHKYRLTAMAYEAKVSSLPWLETELENVITGNTTEQLASCYQYVLEDLSRIRGYAAEGYVYGEGDAMDAFDAEYMDLLMRKGFLTEEEIDEAVSKSAEAAEEAAAELAGLSYERLTREMTQQ